MKLNTCSAVISFFRNLEEKTETFYKRLAQKYPEETEIFTFFSNDNIKNKNIIDRAYYGTISDALEACFSFQEGLDADTYNIQTYFTEDGDHYHALKRTLEIESNIKRAYMDAANLSRYLMADITQAFKTIAKKRDYRIDKIKTALKEFDRNHEN